MLLLVVIMPTLLRSRQAAPSAFDLAPARPPIGLPEPQTALSTPSVQNAPGPTKIDQIVMQSQGYIDRLTVRADTGSARSLTATLRFPAGRTDAGVIELKKLGRLLEETQNSSDITSQYVDLAARLSNARNSEQRLLDLMRNRTGDLKDVVELEH
jgi:hypothetical protein